MSFTVAAAQYPIDWLDSWDAYEAKLRRWIMDARDRGAELAVFPEYGAMELASLDPESLPDLAASTRFVASLEQRVDVLHAALAREFELHILAASLPSLRKCGQLVNSARLFAPSGARGVQDKLIMTRFEREEWGIAAGRNLRLFRTELGLMGVTICYDSEFPLISRALVEEGAELLLVPSCTDALHGYWRVRIGAQARALEGQCYAVHAPTVGEAAWSEAVDANRGAAGVYGPPDLGFPDDGVVAIGKLDQPSWVMAEVDLDRVRTVRAEGRVLNVDHWPEQPGAASLPPVELVELF